MITIINFNFSLKSEKPQEVKKSLSDSLGRKSTLESMAGDDRLSFYGMNSRERVRSFEGKKTCRWSEDSRLVENVVGGDDNLLLVCRIHDNQLNLTSWNG